MTGSGKTAAFLLPILHRLMGKAARHHARARAHADARARGADRGAPAGSSRCTRRSPGAAVFGGVGMGPQEHAFRSGVDVIVATPGRLLDHFKQPYAKLDRLEVLVLDEADRMLDMGFLPDIKRVLKHLPAKRQTLFFSATMPAPIQALTRELLHNPATINLERKSAPAVGIRQARLRGAGGAQAGAVRGAASARGHRQRDRVHAHEAPGQPAGRLPHEPGDRRTRRSTATARRRSAPRRSTASSRGGTAASWRRTSWRAGSTWSSSSTW